MRKKTLKRINTHIRAVVNKSEEEEQKALEEPLENRLQRLLTEDDATKNDLPQLHVKTHEIPGRTTRPACDYHPLSYFTTPSDGKLLPLYKQERSPYGVSYMQVS